MKKKSKETIKKKNKLTVESFMVAAYNDALDTVEKDHDLISGELEQGPRLSTGLLMADLITGGGLVPGLSMFSGPEASAKSTLATHTLGAALKTDIPIIQYRDAEGCVTAETLFRINNIDTTINFPENVEEGFTGIYLKIDTIGKTVDAEIYYKGEQEITYIETDSGNTLKGYKHPILRLKDTGEGEWINIEDLDINDTIFILTN